MDFMRLIFLIFMAALAGCKQADYQSPCERFGCHYDAKTELGILFRDEVGQDIYTTDETDSDYMSVSECMGMWYEPSLMVIVTDNVHIDDQEVVAAYYADSSMPVIRLSKSADSTRLNHELVHHYLYLSTGYPDRSHNSLMFLICAGG